MQGLQKRYIGYTLQLVAACLLLFGSAARADIDVELFGIAAGGGTVQVTLNGVNDSIPTLPGDTPAILADALATTLAGNPALAGVAISADGNRVVTDGDFTDIQTTDAGVYVMLAPGRVRFEQKISDLAGGFTGTLSNSDRFGTSITSPGDLDGDGVMDLAVGAGDDDDGGTNRGAVWILFLDSDGTVKSQQKISDTSGNFTGELADEDSFGAAIASLGDLDADGVTDLVVGAVDDDDGGTDRGALWILFMNSDGSVKGHQKISALAGNFTGALLDGDNFGRSIGSPGDLDGDGVIDLVVGAPRDNDGGTDRGAFWVLFLNTNGTVKAQQKISDTDGGFGGILDNEDRFGYSLAGLGDLDGDGSPEIAAGAQFDDDGAFNTGAVWILSLNPDGTVKAWQKISDSPGSLTELSWGDRFGYSVASLGDMNGDGIGDLAAGAIWDGNGNRGAVWILMLNSDGTLQSSQEINNTTGGFSGQLKNTDWFGSAAGHLGDLNGDKVADLAVGAIGDGDGGTERGAVWNLFLDGPVAVCADSVQVAPEHCDDGNLVDGDGCSASCQTEYFLQVQGTAAGDGTVMVNVAGVDILVTTTADQTAGEVAQAIADAINGDTTLTELGITAQASGDIVYTNGLLASPSTTDSGLTVTLLPGPPEPAQADGDITLDGFVNVADVLLGYQVLNNTASLTPTQLEHGDVAPLVGGTPAPDGLFTLGDVLLIQRKALGQLDF